MEAIPGVAHVLDSKEIASHHLNHERTGDFVLIADTDKWFTYYYWLDDAKAPDFARCVDIFKNLVMTLWKCLWILKTHGLN